MGETSSEVMRLRERIEQECTAATLGLQGYACIARHDFIEARMEHMGACHQRLIELVGEQDAIRIVIDALDRTDRS